MPILDVEIVGHLPAEALSGLAERIANSAATVLASPPQGTWVKLRFLTPADYAENDGGPPQGTAPIFVSVLQADLPSGNALQEQAAALTQAIATACGRDATTVHVLYEPAARGRISFGGVLRQ